MLLGSRSIVEVLSIIRVLFSLELLFALQRYVIVPRAGIFANILPGVLVAETNDSRVGAKLAGLQANPLLEEAARLKAEDMAAKGYFAHTSPEGLTPWYWLEKVGYPFSYAGENLAVNFSDSKDVVNAWLNSPEHRANMLNNNFTQIGIAAAEGNYEGHSAVFVVQFFGTPSGGAVFGATGAVAPPASAKKPSVAAVSSPERSAAPSSATASSGEKFAAVEGSEVHASGSASVPQVLTVPAVVVSEDGSSPDFWASIIASPKNTVNGMLLGLGALVLLALVLNIFIKIRVQDIRLILNGVVALALIAGFFLLNQLLTLSGTKIL